MQLADLRRVNRRSIHDAGPRYMPGQDPNAPNLQIASIVETIDALGMTEAFRARVDSLRSGVSETSNETPAQFRTNLGRLANSPTQLAASLQALTTASPSEAGTVAAMVRRIAVAVQRAVQLRLAALEVAVAQAPQDSVTDCPEGLCGNTRASMLQSASKRLASLLAQGSEAGPNLFAEELRLLKGGKVPTLGEPVVVDQFGIGTLSPAPWSRIQFVREDAHGNWDGDAFGIEIPFAPVLPIETGAGYRAVCQPRYRDVVEDVVAREALSLSLKDP